MQVIVGVWLEGVNPARRANQCRRYYGKEANVAADVDEGIAFFEQTLKE